MLSRMLAILATISTDKMIMSVLSPMVQLKVKVMDRRAFRAIECIFRIRLMSQSSDTTARLKSVSSSHLMRKRLISFMTFTRRPFPQLSSKAALWIVTIL